MAVPNHISRRRILKGASVLGAAGALAAMPSMDVGYAEPAYPAARGPAGSWVAMVTIAGGPPPFQVLRTFSDGGGYIETSSTSRNVGSPESSGHGTWVRTGADSTRAADKARTFALTFVVDRFDPTTGNLVGTIKVRENATLSETGDTYTSRGAFDFLDLHGTVIAAGTATVQATRIKVEPL